MALDGIRNQSGQGHEKKIKALSGIDSNAGLSKALAKRQGGVSERIPI
jgi:hypothetical protein